MTTTLMKRSLENVNLEVPYKIQRKSRRPRLERQNEPSLQTYKIIFEFGPPQLNLFRYITKKAGILWKEAKPKCILKDGGRPTEGPLLICKDDESNVNVCLKIAGFDVYQHEKMLKNSVMDDERKSVCIFYFGEHFWKTMNEACEQTIPDTIRRASNAYVFIMTASDVERDEAIECCKRFKLCPNSHVISPTSDKTTLYEAFYKVLDENLQTFSSDLETRTSTRQFYAIKSNLNSLIVKLQSRKASIKSPLTKQCLEIIKASRKNGVVGYRLLGNELHIYENERLGIETERRSEIENSIKENFNGQVHFRSLNNVLKPHCAVRCGGYLKNNTSHEVSTVGMFGEIKNTLKRDSIQTVALTTPHNFSSGDIAFLLTGKRIGECIWPRTKGNIHDVSIVKIESSVISSLQRTFFNKEIKIKEIPEEHLLYRDVFKYGATTNTTSGSIEQIDNFQLFDRDVIAISSDDPKSPFSKEGDSGAIVLTIIDENHHGFGVLYGVMDSYEGGNNKTTKQESIAIFLKEALDEFTREKHMTIEFDKI